MSDVGTDVLRERIAEMEKELKQLKAQYALKCSNKTIKERTSESSNFSKCNLENKDIERYSRQMILPEIGVSGIILKNDMLRNMKLSASISKFFVNLDTKCFVSFNKHVYDNPKTF